MHYYAYGGVLIYCPHYGEITKSYYVCMYVIDVCILL